MQWVPTKKAITTTNLAPKKISEFIDPRIQNKHKFHALLNALLYNIELKNIFTYLTAHCLNVFSLTQPSGPGQS